MNGRILANNLRPKSNLIIVRHGQTDLNDKDRVRGWHDVPLNDEGIRQAQKLGAELKDKQLDVIATSDFQRASKTAEIISQASGVPVVIVPALRPWNVGEHTGKESKTVSPVLEHHAEHKPNTPLRDGESFNEFKDRFLHGVQSLLARFPGKTIAVVTHHRGDMLMRAWEKAGMPGTHDIDIKTFLEWEKGIEPGTARAASTPSQMPAPRPQQLAQALR